MKAAPFVGIAIIVAALVFGACSFVKTLTPYVTFDQARQATRTVQVMGKLDKTSIKYIDNKSLNFNLVDDHGDRLPVAFTASRPANFDDAIQVTAIGTYDGQTFNADNLLVKCPSKYQDSGKERSYSRGLPPGSIKSQT